MILESWELSIVKIDKINRSLLTKAGNVHLPKLEGNHTIYDIKLHKEHIVLKQENSQLIFFNLKDVNNIKIDFVLNATTLNLTKLLIVDFEINGDTLVFYNKEELAVKFIDISDLSKVKINNFEIPK